MSLDAAYAPPRGFADKIGRRVTQWRAARPARLCFERPVLSVCFDDFPHSAATDGAPILESFGVRGAFYASAGLAKAGGPCGPGFTPGDLARLSKAGHEIGCHTYTHRDCARADAFESLNDLARNRDALAAFGHRADLETLAYPYGETRHALKAALPPRFLCARGILPGINRGRVDLAQLRANALFGDDVKPRMSRLLTQAETRNAWLIVFTHDIGDRPSPWGSTPSMLTALLSTAQSAGFAIMPVRDAMRLGQAA